MTGCVLKSIHTLQFLFLLCTLGEDPRLIGFFHMCGFNASGVVLSGGCGEQLAKWIVEGRPDFHMYPYDVRYE